MKCHRLTCAEFTSRRVSPRNVMNTVPQVASIRVSVPMGESFILPKADPPQSNGRHADVVLWGTPAEAARALQYGSPTLDETAQWWLPSAKDERCNRPKRNPGLGAHDIEILPKEVHLVVGLVFCAGGVVDLRAPETGCQRTTSGYLPDSEQLARSVARLDRNDWQGIYWTINPVKALLEATPFGKLKPSAEATTLDHSILGRQLLPVQFASETTIRDLRQRCTKRAGNRAGSNAFPC